MMSRRLKKTGRVVCVNGYTRTVTRSDSILPLRCCRLPAKVNTDTAYQPIASDGGSLHAANFGGGVPRGFGDQ